MQRPVDLTDHFASDAGLSFALCERSAARFDGGRVTRGALSYVAHGTLRNSRLAHGRAAASRALHVDGETRARSGASATHGPERPRRLSHNTGA